MPTDTGSDYAQAYLDLLKQIEDRAPAVNRILANSSVGYRRDKVAAFLRAFDMYVERDKEKRHYGDTFPRVR